MSYSDVLGQIIVYCILVESDFFSFPKGGLKPIITIKLLLNKSAKFNYVDLVQQI